MEAFLISISTVALAEIGDRTQLLALLLATRFRQPAPILAAIACAAVANHIMAALVGIWIGDRLNTVVLDGAVGAGMIVMAAWMLKPEKPEDEQTISGQRGVFVTTLITFFVAELGDKTQIATVAMAAHFPNPVMVVIGTTLGMLIADVPAVFVGDRFSKKIPMKLVHSIAAAMFAVMGVLALLQVDTWIK